MYKTRVSLVWQLQGIHTQLTFTLLLQAYNLHLLQLLSSWCQNCLTSMMMFSMIKTMYHTGKCTPQLQCRFGVSMYHTLYLLFLTLLGFMMSGNSLLWISECLSMRLIIVQCTQFVFVSLYVWMMPRYGTIIFSKWSFGVCWYSTIVLSKWRAKDSTNNRGEKEHTILLQWNSRAKEHRLS